MVIALIVSGGKGLRMGSEIPKQFLPLLGVPVLQRTLETFDQVEEVDEIVLVLPDAYFDYFKSTGYVARKPLSLVPAGRERQDSVWKGLERVHEIDPESLVLIHDGVRPLVTERVIRQGIDLTRKYRACACGVHPKDTVKRIGENGFSLETLNRSQCYLMHTPQCFFTKDILHGHRIIRELDKSVTDDTMVYEEFYGPVFLYEDDYTNIKITTAEDLLLAEQILRETE